MNKFLTVALATGVLVASSYAAPFYNITDYDGYSGPQYEDGEMDAPFSDFNDLEAVYWNGNDLQIVGEYNFKDGFPYNGNTIYTGDILVDLSKDKSWDLALRFDFSDFDATTGIAEYDVIEVSSTIDVPQANHRYSSPFKGVGTPVGSGYLKFTSGLTDVDVGFNSNTNTHYSITLYGLNDFGMNESFGVHYTMSCGNDMIKGNVPEPAFLSFLGLSILSLAFVRKSKKS